MNHVDMLRVDSVLNVRSWSLVFSLVLVESSVCCSFLLLRSCGEDSQSLSRCIYHYSIPYL